MNRHYYNEIDKFAAAWLRELIAAGEIPAGDVDERSIEDVRPVELAGYIQCHFFAGIGGWPLALRIAGWPRSLPCWTASCPCGPFSAAGKGRGFADERHLWPAYFHLHSQQRPPVLFGEQVASKAGLAWLDLVSDDLEGTGYAIGAQDLCSAGVGFENIRQRLIFVAERLANAYSDGSSPANSVKTEQGSNRQRERLPIGDGATGDVADTQSVGVRPGLRNQQQGAERRYVSADDRGADELESSFGAGPQGFTGHGDAGTERSGATGSTATASTTGKLGDATRRGRGERGHAAQPRHRGHVDSSVSAEQLADAVRIGHFDVAEVLGRGLSASIPLHGSSGGAGKGLGGFWRPTDLVYCRDRRGPKLRPVEAGTFPLATGIPARVGSLRGFGNAINPYLAAEGIAAYMNLRGIQPERWAA